MMTCILMICLYLIVNLHNINIKETDSVTCLDNNNVQELIPIVQELKPALQESEPIAQEIKSTQEPGFIVQELESAKPITETPKPVIQKVESILEEPTKSTAPSILNNKTKTSRKCIKTHTCGLLHYRQWWERTEVNISVNGKLITGTPIFIEQNTLRVINKDNSYFIPLEKVDYICTNDGLESSFNLSEKL